MSNNKVEPANQALPKPIPAKFEVSVGVSFEAMPETGAPGPWVVIVINGNPIGLRVIDAMHFSARIAGACQQILDGALSAPEGKALTRSTDKVQ